jgi:hypothetical protein
MTIVRARRRVVPILPLVLVPVLVLAPTVQASTESLEFVAEHLPEVAMDNRYAGLSLGDGLDDEPVTGWRPSLSLAYSDIRVGTLSFQGPMMSLGASRALRPNWALTIMGFVDTLRASGGLELLSVSATPLQLPAEAEFSGLAGEFRDLGGGVFLSHRTQGRWIGEFEWSAGLLWQQISLEDYAWRYRVLEGPDAGAQGVVDYSATYSHLTPLVGIAWPRMHGHWISRPHVQVALPLPRRGVIGAIQGANFKVSGDTEAAGHGKHFGDPSVTLGWDFTYRPWSLTVDVGSVLTQSIIEPFIHEGVDRNWTLSAHWSR